MKDGEKLNETFFLERIFSNENEFLSTVRKNKRINFIKSPLSNDKQDPDLKRVHPDLKRVQTLAWSQLQYHK